MSRHFEHPPEGIQPDLRPCVFMKYRKLPVVAFALLFTSFAACSGCFEDGSSGSADELRCDSAALSTSSALPLEQIPLDVDVAGGEPDSLWAEVQLEDSVSYTSIEKDEEGTWRLLVPPHPSGIDGGDLSFTVHGDGFSCESEIPFTVKPMEPAPGTLQAAIAGNMALREAQAEFLGFTLDDLRTDDPESLPPHLWGAAIAVSAHDGDANPAALSKILDGSSPYSAELKDGVEFAEALLARLGYLEAQQAALAKLEGLDKPDAPISFMKTSALSTRRQAICEGYEYRVHIGNDASKLNDYMYAAKYGKEWAESDELNFGSRMAGYMGLAKHPVAKASSTLVGLVTWYDKLAHTMMGKTFPSKITKSTLNVDITDFAEDSTEKGHWSEFRIWASSEGMDVTPAMIEGVMNAVGAISGTKDLMGRAEESNLLSDWLKLEAENKLGDLISKVRADDNPCNIPPFRWGPVNASGSVWSDARYRGAIQGVDADRRGYEPARVGEGVVIVKVRSKSFPPAGNRLASMAAATVTVHRIQMSLDPQTAGVEPGGELQITANVGWANDRRVEWEVIAGGGTIGNSGATDASGNSIGTLTAPDDPDEFPVTVMAKSIANTGLRNGAVDADPRVAFGSYRRLGEVKVEPYSACISPGESQDFNAELMGLDGDVSWTSSGGDIDDDGLFKSDEEGEFTVTATSAEHPDQSDRAYVRVGDCSCYFEVFLGGPYMTTFTGYEDASAAWTIGGFATGTTDQAGNTAQITRLFATLSPQVGKFEAMFVGGLAELPHLVDTVETLPDNRGTVNIVDLGETWAEGTYSGTGYIFGSFITGEWIPVPIRARFRVFREGADRGLFDSNGKCVD